MNQLELFVDFTKDPTVKFEDFMAIPGLKALEIEHITPSDVGLTAFANPPVKITILFFPEDTLRALEYILPLFRKVTFWNIRVK